ncbi:MAG: RdgB/HAM1 family non-canonical purine NTP pyrophosphatase [Actinomycetota bacterium]|jgi:XTP/dITP diphosphohydrolase|nr:RdgB/HAM1 family non-canonical purine NTP pyrophosphatase [Actinomycetota bacterium]MCL6092898.1 RdgB/HAM1 family non-canonical purine NTP pyrophosphatase [Actinomycetota bacterium]MDA8166470.1 RdgB/HAM1 family non-canonical purine NTP pyrophosphatase [Actinomycetota bacterium]
MPTAITLASSNPNKAREFEALLEGIRVEPMPAGFSLPEETGSTFYENARLKAMDVREQFIGEATLGDGRVPWVMADDSGIEVAALAGAPGIFSSRYAGEDATDVDNVNKLLHELAGREDRRARFVCDLVLITPGGEVIHASGVLEGRIAEEPHGAFGFGYDPVFIPENHSLTVSQLSAEEKNRISHRARAALSLLDQLRGGKSS